jgi:hypothetical protein
MDAILIIGIIVGVVALIFSIQSVSLWSRAARGTVLFALGIYGFVPAIFLRIGLTEVTTFRVLVAIGYFITFDVIGAVALSGAIVRTERR